MTKTSKEIPVVSNVEETSHVLSDKAGINAFARYLRSINIIGLIFFFLSFLRKSAKGASIYDLINQILCNFALGTARSLSHFDVLKNDEGYAAAIEIGRPKRPSTGDRFLAPDWGERHKYAPYSQVSKGSLVSQTLLE